jgi:chemosensory pili system protein ChpC
MAADKLKCVILTLRKENVVMPNSLVAEIISVKEVDEKPSAPDWYLGQMNWRGVDVPLLSFEAAGGEQVTRVNLNTQAVIFYAVGNRNELPESPYLALVMSGVPHVSEFTRDQIVTDSTANMDNDHPMIAQKVRINGASVSVLDVDAMVDMVSELAA